MKKIVQRICIGCNLKKDRKDLLRLVLTKNGDFLVDEKGKSNGRGMYICKDLECLEKARKNKKLNKTFGITIDDDLYNSIRSVILSKEVKN